MVNISSKEVRALQNATPDQFAQAESLILRGKAGAVRGDPVLQPIVNALAALGVQSAESKRIKSELLKKQTAAQSQQAQTKPLLTVEPYQRPKEGFLSEKTGLAPLTSKLQTKQEILLTAKRRSKTGKIGVGKEAQLVLLQPLAAVLSFAKGIVDLPETAYKVYKNPAILKDIPKSVKQSGVQFGETLRVSPTAAFTRVGSEIVLLGGSSKAIGSLSKASSKTLTKLNPKYVGTAKIGKTLKVPTGGGKVAELKVVGKIPKEKLASQINKAGKRVNAISSQADALLTTLKKSQVIRKPIPGEKSFNAATKKLLKKFDEGTITKKELIELDAAVQSQGAKGLLERSFFADPSGKIRPSRLGTKETKTKIIDYFTEDITFKKSKPQILLFSDIKVEAFPKALKKVAEKLKKGKALAKKEADQLLEFQLKKSGKLKPLGFVSAESELTLAPGEIIKKGKTVGKTIVDGKTVPIIKAEIYKPTGKAKNLLNKLNKGKLTKAETKQLDKLLKKNTGFDYGLSSSPKKAAKYVSVKRVGISSIRSSKPSTTKKKRKGIKVKRIIPKAQKRKPTKKQLSQLSKQKRRVKKVTKASAVSKAKTQKYKKTSRKTSKKPSLPRSPRKVSRLSSSRRKITSTSRKRRAPGYPRSARYPRYPKSPGSPRKGSSKKKPKKYPPRSPPRSPPVRSPPGKPGKLPSRKGRKVTKKPGKKIAYNIYEKRAGKFVKLKFAPLSLKDAKDKLAFRLDNKISRTAKLVPAGKVKKLGKLRSAEKGYFKKYRSNLRNYKIVKGRKVKTPLTFVEKKGKGVISTKGEKRQLQLNRRMKARPRVKRKITRTRNTVKRPKTVTKRKRITVKRTKKTPRTKPRKRIKSSKKKKSVSPQKNFITGLNRFSLA